MRAVERVERQTEQRAAGADDRVGREPHDATSVRTSEYSKRCLIDRVRLARSRSTSQSRNASAGSTPTTSGTDAIGSPPRSHAASRTASFSVVNTIIDPVAFASAAIRLTSRAVNR